MKEKFSVTLGGMHLVAGVTASLLFAGAAFVGGMKVEKARQGDLPSTAQNDPLATLDAREQKFAEARDDASVLTFQDELTRQRPMEPLAPVPTPSPAPVVQPQAAPPSSPPAAAAAKSPARAEREPPRAPPKAAATVAPAKAAAPASRPSGESALREALARGASQPSRSSERASDAGGAFTLQISASQSRDEAERFASQLRERGYAPYIVEAHVPGKGTFFRVRMGRFGSKDAAQKYLTDLRRESQVEAFVTPAQ